MNDKNVTPKLLNDCHSLYFGEGAAHIIDQLCNIGEENRPFHCTDASRGNYIYKTNDKWRVDAGGEEIKAILEPVITKAYTKVHKKGYA